MINIDSEIQSAIRNKQTTRLAVLRNIKTAVSNVLTSKGRGDSPLSEDEFFSLIRKLAGQRKESIDAYIAAGRHDAATVEKNELDVLDGFLPDPLTADEVDDIITQAISDTNATSRKDTGRAIAKAKELSGGRADPRILSQLIAAKLA